MAWEPGAHASLSEPAEGDGCCRDRGPGQTMGAEVN